MNFIIVYLIIGFSLFFTTSYYILLKKWFNELIFSNIHTKEFDRIILGVLGILTIAVFILLFISLYPLDFLIRIYTVDNPKYNSYYRKQALIVEKEKAELSKKYEGISPLSLQIIRVKNTPFRFSTDQIIYFEGEYNTFLNDYFQREYKKVCNIIGTKTEYSEKGKRTFIYIPKC
jgi:hypothetical protein